MNDPIVRSWLKVLAIICIGIIAILFVVDFANPHRPKPLIFCGRGCRNIWKGNVAVQIDKYLLNTSRVFKLTRPYLAVAMYKTTGEVQSDVGVGKNGFLFHQWEIKDCGAEGVDAAKQNVRILGRCQEYLKTKGIEIWFVIVPSKIRIYPEYLYPSGKVPSYMQGRSDA